MNPLSTQEAPGELEKIRDFLNTWRVPNDTRTPVDLLSRTEALHEFQSRHFPSVSMRANLDETLKLRNDLRDSLGTHSIQTLNEWLNDYEIRAVLGADDAGVATVQYVCAGDKSTLCGELLRIVVESVAKKQWQRMKACPDCKWVHYDNTKNGSKVWCGMAKGSENGRACGTIAKVNRWRDRHRGGNGHA